MYYSRRFKVVSAIALACFTAPLIAQTQIEEVLVTASKTGAVSTQDISSSVQAFNESTLEKMGVVEFTDFSRSVPGLDVIDKGPGQKTYIMRGISGPGESTVGVYIDNVPMIGSGQDAATSGGNQPDMGSFDMARIEVVRGPQGTLYGQNSVSGIVRYITNKPDASAFESRIQLDGAIVDEGSPDRALRGMVNIPLIDDTMALRLVGYTKSSGGFIDNVVLGKDAACYQRNLPNPGGNGSLIPELSLEQSAACGDGEVADGQEDVNSYTISGLRAQLGYEIDDESSLLLQFFRQETDIDNRTASNPFDSSYSIGPPFIPGSSLFFTDAAGQYETNVRSNEPHEDTSTIFGLEYERDLDWATLTVGFNSMERDITDSLDSSSPARLHRRFMLTPLGPWGGAVLSRDDRVISHQEQGVEQKTFEARLAGELTDGLTYITGVYFQDLDTSLNSRVFNTDAQTGDVIPGQPLILHRIAGVEQTSKAIFGEAYYQVNDQIEIMGGLRWFEMERDQVSNLVVPFVNSVPIGGPPGDQPSNPQTFDDVTFKAQITYRPTDDVQLYLTSSEGFRSGGVNAQITPAIPPDFEPDTAKSLEFGVKSTWMDGRLYANFSIYDMVWQNLQMSAAFTNQFNGMVNCTEANDPASSKGWEAEFVYQFNDAVNAGVNYTSMNAQWDVDPDTCLDAAVVASLSDPLGGFDGQSLVGVPDASGSAFVDVEFDWFDNYPGFARVDVAYQSDVPVNQMRVDRNVVNPSYLLANLRLGATMGNYDVALYVKNLTNEDANLSFFNNFQQENRVTPSQPRTIGLTFDARF